MFCLGSSFSTTVIFIACVLIYITPLKTTHQSDLQLAGRVSGNEGEEPSESGQDTDTEVNPASADQNIPDPSGKPVKVKAVRMSALWPKTGDHPVIPYFLASETTASGPNLSFINSIVEYVQDKTCITFNLLFPKKDCFVSVSDPTVCVMSDPTVGVACFSDETGCQSGAAFDDEAQILHAPSSECPFHEAVQSMTKLLGLLQEHRRSDRDDTLRVTVTASGTDRLLFAQGQTARCTDYEDDSPLDLFSATGLDTSATTLRHGAIDGVHAIEPGMVIGVRDIRHQWILDYKRQRNMGLSFYDQRDLVRAYGCEKVWGCADRSACANGGFRDRSCRCVCPLGFGGKTCSARTIPAGEDGLRSNCSTLLRSQFTFTLADIGLQHDGHQFYACDMTLVPPGCMRTLVQVNTSSLRPLRDEKNPDLKDNNWCELYFTLMLKHSVMGWRTYCLDYFFNEETLLFMSHSSIEQTYGYIKMHVPRQEVFSMVTGIVFNITFVEVPECGEKGARDKGGAVIHTHSYTVMTAVFSYVAGVMLGIVGWIVMRGLCMSHQDEYPSHDGSLASSGSSSYDSLPPARTPTPRPGAGPPPPAIRLPTPEVRAPTPDTRSPSPDTRSPPPDARPPPPYPPVSRPPQPPPGDRPMRPATENLLPPPPGSRPPPQQETHLPPIGGAGQRLSPRQGGLRASFVQWGGAALNSMRASFAATSRPPQGQPGAAPQGGSRPPPQGGSRPPPQGGSRPQGARPPKRYKTSPARPGTRRAPP